jgi:CRISPR/Cas system CSM-associated protein Csm2 small subunit
MEKGPKTIDEKRKVIEDVVKRIREASSSENPFEGIMNEAEKVAKSLGEIREGKFVGVSTTKFRQYFAQFKALAVSLNLLGVEAKPERAEKAKSEEEKALKKVEVALHKIKARIAYDTARAKEDRKKKPDQGDEKDYFHNMKMLFEAAIDVILQKDADMDKTVIGFSDLLECVIGYHYFDSHEGGSS